MKCLLPLVASLLLMTGCAQSSVGEACTVDADCDTGQTCLTALPGGFCSKGCSVEGSTNECPGGSVCSKQAERLVCAHICEEQLDCRADYECNGMTGSSVKSCRAK